MAETADKGLLKMTVSALEKRSNRQAAEIASLKAEVERLRRLGNDWLQQKADQRKEIARLTAEAERLRAVLEFVERWAIYKRYKPDGKNLTAEEAISVIAFHPAIREISLRYEASGDIDMVAYDRDRAALTQEPRT
jgi:hypothetical protein